MSLQSDYSQLESAFKANDLAKVAALLPKIKVELAKSNLLFPSGSSFSTEDLLIARSTLEIGAFYSVRTGKSDAFARYIAQLGTFYSNRQLPVSTFQPTLISLSLLSYLSTSLSTFHTTLETLSADLLATKEILRVVELERALMEGKYGRILRGGLVDSANGDDQDWQRGVAGLQDTVRNEIALCAEKSYLTLTIQNAQSLLFLNSPSEVVTFANRRGWTLSPSSSTIYFHQTSASTAATETAAYFSSEGMKSLIDGSLGYAKELESIV